MKIVTDPEEMPREVRDLCDKVQCDYADYLDNTVSLWQEVLRKRDISQGQVAVIILNSTFVSIRTFMELMIKTIYDEPDAGKRRNGKAILLANINSMEEQLKALKRTLK